MIEAQGIISADDYVRAQRLHLRPRPLFRVLGTLMLGLFTLALGASTWAGLQAGSLAGPPLVLGGAGAYLALWYFVWLPIWARRTYAQQKTMHVPVTLRLDDGGLSMASELSASTLPWNLLHRWKENAHLFLIYHASNVFTPLPKRFLSPEAAVGARALLAAHLKGAT